MTGPSTGSGPAPALIATDVDGTLLDGNDEITARTRAAVHAAVAGGARFVLATGRPPRWIRPIADMLGFAPIAVCANGAVVYDPATDRVLSAQTLPAELLGELTEVIEGVIPGAGLAVERIGERAHDAATPQFVSLPGYEHAWLSPDNTEVSKADLLSAPAIKLLVRKVGAASADLAAELTPRIGSVAEVTFSTNNGLVEIVPAGVDKGTGVEQVIRPLGIGYDRVVTFGDMPNDLPMLLRAGHGVAMGNAHPDVLAAAAEVTAPNTDDGLARVLERWW
ncbi:MAG TPA: HAD family hydrolase [Mycobacterium sp.]|nr:HAD family hydrolase [Mycobacterium sp.]